jgi:hypothetical protein
MNVPRFDHSCGLFKLKNGWVHSHDFLIGLSFFIYLCGYSKARTLDFEMMRTLFYQRATTPTTTTITTTTANNTMLLLQLLMFLINLLLSPSFLSHFWGPVAAAGLKPLTLR